MPREVAWLVSLVGSPLYARLGPADQEKLVQALTLGTRTLRDFVPSVLYGLN